MYRIKPTLNKGDEVLFKFKYKVGDNYVTRWLDGYLNEQKKSKWNIITEHEEPYLAKIDGINENDIYLKKYIDIHKINLKQSRNLKNITGPISFHWFPKIKNSNKKILFLGDMHLVKKRCDDEIIHVDDWLKDIALLFPKNYCLDIFVETDYIVNQAGGKVTNAPLNDVRRAFLSCYSIHKTRCIYDNVRYHYIDLRMINSGTSIGQILRFKFNEDEPELYDKIINLYTKNNVYPIDPFMLFSLYSAGKPEYNKMIDTYFVENERYIETDEMLFDLIHWCFGFTNDKKTEDIIFKIINEIFDIVNVHGQFIHFSSSIKKYYKLYYDKIQKELDKLSIDKELFKRYIDNIFLPLRKMLGYSEFNNFHFFYQFIKFKLDIARMFIKLKEDKMQRGPLLCRNEKSREFNNIIVYAGDNHILFMTTFFKVNKLGDPDQDYDIYRDNDEDNITQCITLEKPFDYIGEVINYIEDDEKRAIYEAEIAKIQRGSGTNNRKYKIKYISR